MWTTEKDKFYLIRNTVDGNIVVDYYTNKGNRKKAIFTTRAKAQEVIDKYLSDIYRVAEIEDLED